MPLVELLSDLQQIDKVSAPDHAPLILGAFAKHTPFDSGALYLRETRDAPLRLAASHAIDAPAMLADDQTIASARLFVPLRTTRDHLGMLALSGDGATDEDVRSASAAATYLAMLMANHRLLQETREGDFQLKYRLWELESLYDIGLSIASTLNIDDLADQILFRMISLMNARGAALYLREKMRFRQYRTFGDLEVDDTMLDRAVREARPIGSDGRLVAVPIKGNNDIIGVLAVADRETREGGIGAF